MEYIEVDIRLNEVDPFADIIIAKLNDINFESYIEDDSGVKAYVQFNLMREKLVVEVIEEVAKMVKLSYTIQKVKTENWNKQWESSFEPVYINERCVVRAHFHEPFSNFEYELVITPKMSFGTGHHETTFLMMNEMFSINFTNKSVLDVGTGTGVLAILAAKLNAKSVIAVDIDKWAYDNARENAELNSVSNINFIHANINVIGTEKFDVILANINRNIILKDIKKYVSAMNNKSEIILSGFLKEDIPHILEKSSQLGIKLVASKNKNKWQILYLKKL